LAEIYQMQFGVSVIICTHNGANHLPETIKHLALQIVEPDIPWEIIVIDNASTDNTKEVAIKEWARYSVPHVSFRMLDEFIPGKSNAIEKGVRESNYGYILICDDDNWLSNNYISNAFRLMKHNDKIGIAGGQGLAVADQKFPKWFKTYQYAYAVGKQANVSGELMGENYLWGAGMVFKKQLYRKSYSKYAALLGGSRLPRGEDIEFCLRSIFLGYTLFYDETLVYKHYLSENKLTTLYRDRLYNGSTDVTYILSLYSKQFQISKMSNFQKIKLLLLSIARFLACLIKPLNNWDTKFECEVIYLLTSFELNPISNECKVVRQVYIESKHICSSDNLN
jgi:glycosyltransferase involved in cell wall biosynthesis